MNLEKHYNREGQDPSIFIAGSMSFYESILWVKDRLLKAGFGVVYPINFEIDTNKECTLELKSNVEKHLMDAIKNCSAILVVNKKKNGVDGYIGGATFMEMTFAFKNNISIFVMKDIPESLPYYDEIKMMKPTVLGDLGSLPGREGAE